VSCSRSKTRRAVLASNQIERFGLVAMPNKNPARGSGRAQLLSFNFLNALICAGASTARMPFGIYPPLYHPGEIIDTARGSDLQAV
jgi:hypothetical protein